VVGTGFRAEMEASEGKLDARTCKGKCGVGAEEVELPG